jgi:ribosome-associated protein
LSDDLIINERITIPGWEFDYSSSRSSGPGGQSVNKTNSRISLRWHIDSSSALTPGQKTRVKRKLKTRLDSAGYLAIHAETDRSQLRNKELARERLGQLVVDALVIPKRRRATRPSRAAKERRIEGKKQLSVKKGLRKRPQSDD